MIDENKLIDFIPSIAIREAIKKENIHYSDYEWFNILLYIDDDKHCAEKSSMIKYLNENTNDENVKRYTKNYLICDYFKNHKILNLFYNWISYHLDFGKDSFVYIPHIFNKGDVVFCYTNRDIMTINSKISDEYEKEYKNKEYCDNFHENFMLCLYGTEKVSENEMIDIDERGEHMCILELDYIENIYKDTFSYTRSKEFKEQEQELISQME